MRTVARKRSATENVSERGSRYRPAEPARAHDLSEEVRAAPVSPPRRMWNSPQWCGLRWLVNQLEHGLLAGP